MGTYADTVPTDGDGDKFHGVVTDNSGTNDIVAVKGVNRTTQNGEVVADMAVSVTNSNLNVTTASDTNTTYTVDYSSLTHDHYITTGGWRSLAIWVRNNTDQTVSLAVITRNSSGNWMYICKIDVPAGQYYVIYPTTAAHSSATWFVAVPALMDTYSFQSLRLRLYWQSTPGTTGSVIVDYTKRT